jgi:hypothetical protein
LTGDQDGSLVELLIAEEACGTHGSPIDEGQVWSARRPSRRDAGACADHGDRYSQHEDG